MSCHVSIVNIRDKKNPVQDPRWLESPLLVLGADRMKVDSCSVGLGLLLEVADSEL